MLSKIRTISRTPINFYVDYELYHEPLSEPVAYFHAHWHRVNPCRGWAPQLQVNSPEVNIPHLDRDGNYVILETEGRGHYVGCNLSVAHFQGSWWGEGDEMIFVDNDEEWPPSLHGTGSEDYFGHAWGMQNNASLMNGSALHESIIPGYQVSYRFHLADPIHFAQRISVTLEHGHANHLSDDWSSTAYWYHTLPSPVRTILPVEQRLPTVLGAETRSSGNRANNRFRAISRALEAARERMDKYKQIRENISCGRLRELVNIPGRISSRPKPCDFATRAKTGDISMLENTLKDSLRRTARSHGRRSTPPSLSLHRLSELDE